MGYKLGPSFFRPSITEIPVSEINHYKSSLISQVAWEAPLCQSCLYDIHKRRFGMENGHFVVCIPGRFDDCHNIAPMESKWGIERCYGDQATGCLPGDQKETRKSIHFFLLPLLC